MKTKISVRFKKPGGLSLSRYKDNGERIYNYGVTHPELSQVDLHKYIADHPEERDKFGQIPPREAGNAWVVAYNFDKVFMFELLDEEPGELPEHIAEAEDAEMARSYRLRTAELAAHNHALNNLVREDLRDAVERGHIEIISDSFMDKRAKKKTAK